MTEQELREIEGRLEGTTPGEWRWNGARCVWTREAEPPDGTEELICDVNPDHNRNSQPDSEERDTNADFIAHAHQDIPALCQALREAWDWCARLSQDRAGETGLFTQAQRLERTLLASWLRSIAENSDGGTLGVLRVGEIIDSLNIQALPGLTPWDEVRAKHADYEQALRAIVELCDGPKPLGEAVLGSLRLAKQALGEG